MIQDILSHKQLIDAYIKNFLASKKQGLSDVNTWGADVIDRLTAFTNRGKTIRGSLLLWSAELFEIKSTDALLPVAGAVELIHSGLLIHDDIMDRDELRRGNPTLHNQYATQTKEAPDPAYGQSMATCAGDAAFFLGFNCLSGLDDEALRGKLALEFSQEYAAVCIAQMQDVSFAASRITPSIADVESLYAYKTGRYTFSLPLRAGALAAGAAGSELDQLSEIGRLLGLLFQIRDDELNLFGKSGTSGKPVGSDIREAKKTVYIATLYDVAAPADKHELESIFSHVPLNAGSQARVYGLLEKYGIRNNLEIRKEALATSLTACIDKLVGPEAQKQPLRDLVVFVRMREQ